MCAKWTEQNCLSLKSSNTLKSTIVGITQFDWRLILLFSPTLGNLDNQSSVDRNSSRIQYLRHLSTCDGRICIFEQNLQPRIENIDQIFTGICSHAGNVISLRVKVTQSILRRFLRLASFDIIWQEIKDNQLSPHLYTEARGVLPSISDGGRGARRKISRTQMKHKQQ